MASLLTGALIVGAVMGLAACNRGTESANAASPAANAAVAEASRNAAAAATPAPAAAADEAAVRALLDRIYAQYAREGADHLPWTETFEPELAAGLATDHGAPESDPYTGAQDFTPFRATYDGIRVNGDRAEATASFTNMGTPTRIQYQLVRTPAGWRVHDVQTPDLPSLRARVIQVPA